MQFFQTLSNMGTTKIFCEMTPLCIPYGPPLPLNLLVPFLTNMANPQNKDGISNKADGPVPKES